MPGSENVKQVNMTRRGSHQRGLAEEEDLQLGAVQYKCHPALDGLRKGSGDSQAA